MSKVAFDNLMQTWPMDAAAKLAIAFSDYLKTAVEACKPRYFANKKEGYWQNHLCIEWGLNWKRSYPFLIIDRECVVGFDKGSEKEAYYKPLLRQYTDVRDQLQRADPAKWGQEINKTFGDELDMLAIDRQGNLIVIELKHGSNASGIYWGPLQVMVYRDAFRSKLGEITSAIKELVAQKIQLGLLPEAARPWVPAAGFPAVKTVLAVAEPNDNSKCWSRLDKVLAELNAAKSVCDTDSRVRLINLEQA